jgi:phosphate transport system permease protein
VLPAALPGILTGTILSISRAVGETAPLLVVGAAGYLTSKPHGIFDGYSALPIQIYNWTTRPQSEFREVAAAGIIVLLIVLLTMNAVAIILRQRFTNRARW